MLLAALLLVWGKNTEIAAVLRLLMDIADTTLSSKKDRWGLIGVACSQVKSLVQSV